MAFHDGVVSCRFCREPVLKKYLNNHKCKRGSEGETKQHVEADSAAVEADLKSREEADRAGELMAYDDRDFREGRD